MKVFAVLIATLCLVSCAKETSGFTAAVGVMYVNGQVADVVVLGIAKDMGECRAKAAAALKATPAGPGLRIGCASIELQ